MIPSFGKLPEAGLYQYEEAIVKSNTSERWHADCMDCGTPTFECMGLVLASDFIAYIEAMERGQQPGPIRVRCGQCVDEIMLLQTEKRRET